MNTEELLDAFKEMTLLELSQFIKSFEETFGVTATPVIMADDWDSDEVNNQIAKDFGMEDEPEEWTVTITGIGDKKIQVIKEVRTITKLGLSDAKTLVDNIPNSVVENVSKARAVEVKTALEKTGATVTMVPSA